jgi:hypothetical protein
VQTSNQNYWPLFFLILTMIAFLLLAAPSSETQSTSLRVVTPTPTRLDTQLATQVTVVVATPEQARLEANPSIATQPVTLADQSLLRGYEVRMIDGIKAYKVGETWLRCDQRDAWPVVADLQRTDLVELCGA